MHALDLEKVISTKAALASKDSEETASALSELASLNEREMQVLENTTKLDPESLEFTHNEVRLRALVASGSISPLLADIAATPMVEELSEEYYNSRDGFLSEVESNVNEGYNPYDLGGKLTRLVNRGASKAEILAFLEKNTFFKSQAELLEAEQSSADMDLPMALSLYKISSLMSALNQIEDRKIPVDLPAIAKEKISKYDSEGSVAELIDSGAGSKAIFEALKGNTVWESDAEDYLTRDDVEVPRDAQRTSWNEFASILFSIKDLDQI
jgi:hypothetical protein